MAEIKINARGLQCPGPIMALFKTVKEAQSGDVVIVEATEQGFKKDCPAWCKKTGNELLSIEEVEGIITAQVKKA